MKLEASIRPASLQRPQAPPQMVEVIRAGAKVSATLAGRKLDAEAIEISPGLYSVLLGGRSFQVNIAIRGTALVATVDHQGFVVELADPRTWRRACGGASEAEGRQELLAPMPGKIVRVLAAEGAKLEAGQGVLVIEAMKMQNELRSPKSGTLEKLLITEGQAVNSGDVLAVVA